MGRGGKEMVENSQGRKGRERKDVKGYGEIGRGRGDGKGKTG